MTKRALVVLCAASVMALAPIGGARAADAADATLYELTENMWTLLDDGVRMRAASSSLTGTAAVGTPLCPATLVASSNPGASFCAVNATGWDYIDTTTGKGNFLGTLSVVVQGDNAADGPELVVMRGSFSGQMDFSPALLRGVPYGTVVGTVSTSQGSSSFTGVFRLPFAANYAGPETGGATLRQIFCPATPASNAYAPIFDGYDLAYVATSNGVPTGSCIDIGPKEISLGSSLVRFEITFGGAVQPSSSWWNYRR